MIIRFDFVLRLRLLGIATVRSNITFAMWNRLLHVRHG